jgi:hypothetical protein
MTGVGLARERQANNPPAGNAKLRLPLALGCGKIAAIDPGMRGLPMRAIPIRLISAALAVCLVALAAGAARAADVM